MYLADGVAGLTGASAAMIALREVEVNGGRVRSSILPLLDPLFAILSPQAANYRLTARESPGPARARRTRRRATPTGAATGSMSACRARSRRWPSACSERSGAPTSWTTRAFRTNADRLRHVDELDAIIGAFIAERTQDENVAFFEAAEVTIARSTMRPKLVADPHVVERELIADYPDPDMGLIPMHAVVPHLHDRPGSIRTPAPALGQHNRRCWGRSASRARPSTTSSPRAWSAAATPADDSDREDGKCPR